MKTTQGAAPNHIMSTTQVPRPRIEPKTLGVTCSYFTTLPLKRIKVKAWTFTDILQYDKNIYDKAVIIEAPTYLQVIVTNIKINFSSSSFIFIIFNGKMDKQAL